MRSRPFALAVLALALFVVVAAPARAQLDPDTTGASAYDRADLKISQSGRPVGVESFVRFARNDTLFNYSTVRFDGLSADSRQPLSLRMSYLQSKMNSYPISFDTFVTLRDTTQTTTISCVFSDTTVVVYREASGRGRGEAIALPPGRLYLFEPGIYQPVEILLADFVSGKQQTRRQSVFIPAIQRFVDLTITRGVKGPLRWGGRNVTTTKVEMTDGSTTFEAWMDEKYRLLKLEAVGQGLVVERDAAKTPGTTAKTAKKR